MIKRHAYRIFESRGFKYLLTQDYRTFPVQVVRQWIDLETTGRGSSFMEALSYISSCLMVPVDDILACILDEEPKKVPVVESLLFVCDAKKPCSTSLNCYWTHQGSCSHTSDPGHARNFKEFEKGCFMEDMDSKDGDGDEQ